MRGGAGGRPKAPARRILPLASHPLDHPQHPLRGRLGGLRSLLHVLSQDRRLQQRRKRRIALCKPVSVVVLTPICRSIRPM
jgi:hypothetical protein